MSVTDNRCAQPQDIDYAQWEHTMKTASKETLKLDS